MRPQLQQVCSSWADGFPSLRNSLLLEVGRFLTGHCAMNKVLGSQPTGVSILPLVEAEGLCAHNLRFLVPPTSCGQAHVAHCNILLPHRDLSFWKVRDNRGLRLLDSSSVSLGLHQMEWERRLVSRLYS